MDIKTRQTTISPSETASRMVMVSRVSFVLSENKRKELFWNYSHLKQANEVQAIYVHIIKYNDKVTTAMLV